MNPGLREGVGCPLSQMGLPAFECRISPRVLHRLPVEQLWVHRENVAASLMPAEGFRCVSFVYACSMLYVHLTCNIDLEMHAWRIEAESLSATCCNYECKADELCLYEKKLIQNWIFPGFFHLFLFQIYHYAWWHLCCSNWLCECVAHTWRSTKLRLLCVHESVRVCVQITQKTVSY